MGYWGGERKHGEYRTQRLVEMSMAWSSLEAVCILTGEVSFGVEKKMYVREQAERQNLQKKKRGIKDPQRTDIGNQEEG